MDVVWSEGVMESVGKKGNRKVREGARKTCDGRCMEREGLQRCMERECYKGEGKDTVKKGVEV